MTGPIVEVIERYADLMGENWPLMAGLFAGTVLVGLLWRIWASRSESPPPGRSVWLGRAMMALFLAAGIWLALEQASVVDDAFISFRYARNLVDGHGLVFNPGERVEGYTNFLWTAVIAALIALIPLDAPWISLVLTMACFAANVLVVYRIGRFLAGERQVRAYVPLAAALCAVQLSFCSFATTGMETMAASLLVNLGALFLVTRDDARGAALSGAMFILATLTRPDHALFYAAAGAVILVRNAGSALDEVRNGLGPAWRAGGARIAAYAAPFSVYLVYMGWKLVYYGSVLPNTFFAKAVYRSYFSQGALYAATFYLGSNFWVVTLLAVLWIAIPSQGGQEKSFKGFAAIAFVLVNAYVLWVGGDFMYGRFFVCLIPILLLGAEGLVYALAAEPRIRRARIPAWTSLAAAGLLAASAHGTRFVEPYQPLWHIHDQGGHSRVVWKNPPEIRHNYFKVGNLLGRVFADRGITPTLATWTVGMIGYYSRLPLIDCHGLNDPVIARKPIGDRNFPGHEKSADIHFLMRRGAHFVQGEHQPERYADIVKLEFRPPIEPWQIVTYDRRLMHEVAEKVPEVAFVDFEEYLDRYIFRLQDKDRSEVRKDLDWFRRYYFKRNEDPERLAVLESFAFEQTP